MTGIDVGQYLHRITGVPAGDFPSACTDLLTKPCLYRHPALTAPHILAISCFALAAWFRTKSHSAVSGPPLPIFPAIPSRRHQYARNINRYNEYRILLVINTYDLITVGMRVRGYVDEPEKFEGFTEF